MKNAQLTMPRDIQEMLAYSGEDDALHAYQTAVDLIDAGIPVGFPQRDGKLSGYALTSYEAMHRGYPLERRFKISMYKPFNSVETTAEVNSAIREDLALHHSENPAPTPVIPLGESGVIAVCVEGDEAAKRWKQLAPFLGMADEKPSLRWVYGDSRRYYYLLSLAPGFDISALSRTGMLWGDETGGILLMLNDCCIPVPYTHPSEIGGRESVSVRGGTVVSPSPVSKQLSYLLATAAVDEDRCRGLQYSIGKMLAGTLDSGSNGPALRAWVKTVSWEQILGRAGYELCDELFASPCSDGCRLWRHTVTGLVVFAHGPYCLESLRQGLCLEAAAGRIPPEFRSIRRAWHEPKSNVLLGVDTISFSAHEVVTALFYGGDWFRFYKGTGIG